MNDLTATLLLLQDTHGLLGDGASQWWECHRPVAAIQATSVDEVPHALVAAERAARDGHVVAGFISYEAAPAFDAALAVRPAGVLPLLWFGCYPPDHLLPRRSISDAPFCETLDWRPSIDEEEYRQVIARIKDAIACGETYQVNYTFRLTADFAGDPHAFFDALCRSQRARYSAYLEFTDHVLCSVSPELFFTRQGCRVRCMPMKGTVARGLTRADDLARAAWLQASEKNRAENVMIVDMVRNDLGRIAAPGDVAVSSLFAVEQYPTLWQMTSTVEAQSDATLGEIFGALFPCASITGAPKVQTSRIIAELETAPRGIYTGAIGFLTPRGDAQFNVAIRTAHIDRQAGRINYGTGGGITWTSEPGDEYRECLTKARVLTASRAPFALLETLLWKPGSGYFLLDRHLDRLADSAAYFDMPLDRDAITAQLHEMAQTFVDQRQRVRLLAGESGEITCEAQPIPPSPLRRWRVALAREAIDDGETLLYHKTTWREPYTRARAAAPEMDDVLLWNTRGEITESTLANVVVQLDGQLVTPPVSCGLLAGAYRAHLLASGRISERIITRAALADARALYLINSVRGWIPAQLVTAG